MYTFRKEKLQILIEMATFAKQNKRIITYLSTFEKINNLKTFSVSIQREQYKSSALTCVISPAFYKIVLNLLDYQIFIVSLPKNQLLRVKL